MSEGLTESMVKVVCMYDGPRRARNLNPQGAVVREVHRRLVDAEAEADYDVVLVHNGGNPVKAYQDGRLFAYTRENEGGSFGAFADAFAKMGSFYSWWAFQEDDIFVTDLGVFKEAVEFMKVNPKVGFVSLSPISTSPCRHSGGGFGVARREALEALCAVNGGRLPVARTNDYPELERAEVAFTSGLPELGWEIVNLPGVSPFAENWKDHESQREHGEKFQGGRNVYRVGL
jgi:hypothetical protein